MIVGKPAQAWKYPDVNLEQFFKVQIKILHPIQLEVHDRFLPTSERSVPHGQPPQIRRTPQHPQQRPERHPAIPHLDAGQPFAERTPPRANGDDLRTVQLEAGHRWRAAVHSESRVQRDSVWNVDANVVPEGPLAIYDRLPAAANQSERQELLGLKVGEDSRPEFRR
uniref:(northern house mosquito) hypothetical protein n=1 Tax=Culex pipiens TaxID=7175 RepID=A0A8D8A8G4_CULPI